MKLKRKIVGLLSASAIALPTLISISSCNFTRDEYTCPAVSFNGSAIMKPGEGVKTFNLEGFTFSRALNEGEDVTVNVIAVDSYGNAKYDAPVPTATPSYKALSKKMSINFDFKKIFVDDFKNGISKFQLTFTFNYKGKSETYSELTRVFTFNYSALWKDNDIIGNFDAAGYNASLNEDKKSARFEVKNLQLKRQIEEGEDLNVKVSDTTNISFVDWDQTVVSNDTVNLTLYFDIKFEDSFQDADSTFDVNFEFTSGGVIKKPVQKLGCHAIYDRQYIVPEITYTGDKVFNLTNTDVVVPENSDPFVEYSLSNQNCLNINRALNPSFNEKVEIELQDGSGNPLSNLTWKYSAATNQITSYGLEYKPTKGTYYFQDSGDINFQIHWRVYEDKDQAKDKSKEGDITGFTFHFTPIWEEKTVEPFGSFTSDQTITTNSGEWNYSINSSTKENGFKIPEKKLADEEWVSVDLINQESGSGDDTDAIIRSEKVDATYDNTDTYLDFDLGFIDEIIQKKDSQYDDHNAKFQLVFTFHIGEFAYKHLPISHSYTLHFAKQNRPENATATMTGVTGETGQTLLKLTGKLNPDENYPFLRERFLSANVVETSPYVSIVTDEGDLKKGAIIDENNNITLYVKLGTNGQTTPFSYTTKQTFPVKFNFKFSDPTANEVNIKTDAVNVTYTPFSDNMEDYVQKRTVPIILYAMRDGVEGIDRYYMNSFILSKVTNDPNDYTYYIATSKSNKLAFNSFRSLHEGDDLMFGVTDYSFRSRYSTTAYDDRDYYTTVYNACNYLGNYLYFDMNNEKPTIKWVDDELSWSNSKANTSNIAIATMTFNSGAFKDFEGHKKNDPVWAQSYLNKLWELNNYQEAYGHINSWATTPITQEKSKYSGLAIGGFKTSRGKFYDWDDKWWGPNDKLSQTIAQWDYQQINTSNLSYLSELSTEQKIRYFNPVWNEYDYGSDWYYTNTASTYTHECPVYYSSSALSAGSQDAYSLYPHLPVLGSMLTAKIANPGNAAPIVLAGVYWGWRENGLDGWSQFYPYFDIFCKGPNPEDNLLSNYLTY